MDYDAIETLRYLAQGGCPTGCLGATDEEFVVSLPVEAESDRWHVCGHGDGGPVHLASPRPDLPASRDGEPWRAKPVNRSERVVVDSDFADVVALNSEVAQQTEDLLGGGELHSNGGGAEEQGGHGSDFLL